MDYPAYYGLSLNIDRQRRRRAWEHADALEIARGTEALKAPWFEAITDSQTEAGELMYKVNANRMERRVKGRFDRPPGAGSAPRW